MALAPFKVKSIGIKGDRPGEGCEKDRFAVFVGVVSLPLPGLDGTEE